MAQKLNPFSGRQFLDANGDPYVGAQLFVYTAGSSTKTTVAKDSAGLSAHANPIVLNSRGEPGDGSGASQAIWQTEGEAVKLVLAPSTDTDPPIAAISTWDNLTGINDTSVSISQWVSGPTPTYVNATSFTLVGDQTSDFHVGRRIKSTNSGGSIYSTIITSAYTTLTTITVVNDSGVLDSGLSAVSYGLLTATNSSISEDAVAPILGPDIASATALPYPAYGNYSHVTGTTAITSFATSGKIGKIVRREFDGILTLTHHATNLILIGGANITTAAGDVGTFIEYASGDWKMISWQPISGIAIGSPTADQGASMVLLQAQSASASASIDFTTNISSNYDEYELHINQFVPTADGDSMWCKISKDTGSSWVAGTLYRYNSARILDAGSIGYTASAGDAKFILINDIGAAAGEGADGVLKFYNPSNTSVFKHFNGAFTHDSSDSSSRNAIFNGTHRDATAFDGVQVLCSTSTIASGEFYLYGIKKA